ncbi:MAG TPA: hypothetical protein VF169_25040, partial [Albitalea sp.]|uniref:hypothetical protein n=1 Tax=Piscinibacter sp. TaxID=1903157 RepID=UPI002ED049BB
MKRDSGGPSDAELTAMAKTQPWRTRGRAGAPLDLQQMKAAVDQWATGHPGEDRAAAQQILHEALDKEFDSTVKSYNISMNARRLTDLPTDVLNQLAKCFELSVGNNRLTKLELKNPHIQRLLARNNRISELEIKSADELEYLDLANNMLVLDHDNTACLAGLGPGCEVQVCDNKLTSGDIDAHNAQYQGQGASLVAARPRQDDQDLKRLDNDVLETRLLQKNPDEW